MQSYGRRVQFFMQHEAYHAGQLGSLRRALGLPGKDIDRSFLKGEKHGTTDSF
ncbi:MAG: hypothetical protein IPP40_08845 [bacterium]|nr:hypothetical protein [bacterium]